MASRHRERIPPTDDWQQLEFLLETPGQRSYEAIRPAVLFGEPVPERAGATQIPKRTLFRYVARFEAEGLRGLEPPPKLERHRRVPDEVRQAVIFIHPRNAPHEDGLLAGLGCELDESGFAVVDSTGRTSASGMWVAGDAVDPRAPVISAAGAGATAAIAINADLVGGRHRERGRGGGMSMTWLVQPRAIGENRSRVVVSAAQSS